MATAINPNDIEYKDKINQNLELFFLKNKFVIEYLNKKIEEIIQYFNKINIIIDYDDLKEYIIIYSKNYIFLKINHEYNEFIRQNPCSGAISNYNNDFILTHITFDINNETNIYSQRFIEIVNYIININLYIRGDISKPFHNLYLLYTLKKENEEFNYSLSELRYNFQEDLEDIKNNNRKENEDIRIEIKREIKEFNHSLIKLKETIIENLNKAKEKIKKYEELYTFQKEINNETEKKITLLVENYEDFKNSFKIVEDENMKFKVSLNLLKYENDKLLEFINNLTKIFIVSFIISLFALIIK